MANQNVAGETYYDLDGQLLEIKRQLRQQNGYPFDPFKLRLHLQAAIEGNFGPGEVYRVKLGGPTTTDQIAQAWREAKLYVDEHITQKNFPLSPHDPEDVEIEIINPGYSFIETEGLRFLEDTGLERPTFEHVLRFAEQYGRSTKGEKPFIIFLHKAWRYPIGGRRVMSIRRRPGNRRLVLRDPDRGFGDRCVLAGVRPRKQA